MGILGRHKPNKTGTTGSFKSPITAAVERAEAALADTMAKIRDAEASFRELAIAALDNPVEGGQKALAARAELRQLQEHREIAEAALGEARRRETERLTAKSEEQRRSERAALSQHLAKATDAVGRVQSMAREMQIAFSDAVFALDRANAVLDMRSRREIGELLSVDNLRSLVLLELQRQGRTPGTASAIVPAHTQTRYNEFADRQSNEVPSLVSIFEEGVSSIKEASRKCSAASRKASR
jgi:hypothetical protein